jgi:predicted DNA-binding transcriptional regulator AlpA
VRHQSEPLQTTTRCGDLPDTALVRLAMLVSLGLIPFSASTLWRKVKTGEFPKPIRISSHITAWRMGDIRVWAADPSSYRAPEVSNV